MMKKTLILSFFTVVLCSTSFAQKLSIEEAVMGNYGELNPEKLDQLQWIEGEDEASYVEENNLMTVNRRGKTDVRLTLDQLNRQVEDSLTSFPKITWVNKNIFYFSRGKSYYKTNLKKEKTEIVLQYIA